MYDMRNEVKEAFLNIIDKSVFLYVVCVIIGSFQGEIKEQYVKELVCCKEKNHIVLEIKH